MASSLVRTLRRASSSSLIRNAFSLTPRFETRTCPTEPATKSPFDSNILRILRNEIQYQFEYAPPHQPETKFNSFKVEERRGEQVITMKGKFGECEDINIEATMFDACEHVPASGDDNSGVNLRLHLSLIVDVSKGGGDKELEFVCSAWPDGLNIEKVYILRRGRMPKTPYIGPDFRDLNAKVQEKFYKYLDERGLNDELAVFLHEYMMNKDRIELLHWMDSLKSFIVNVTSTKNAITALKLLRENKSMFDLEISDVHLPDMDGFKLVELVGLEMDLPVIMLSVNDDPKMVKKGVTHGACDYLLKPVRIEALKNIWQHVIRKKKVGVKEQNIDSSKGGSVASRNSDQNGNSSKKTKDQDEDEEEEHENVHDNEDCSTQKKPPVVWSVELHSKFVSAVNQLGIEKAVPKRILELMNVEKLTRENVASHQQNIDTADSSYVRMHPLNGIGHLHQLNGPQQFHSNTFRSFPLGGMIGRLNTPVGLNVHAQNLNNSINDPLKFHPSIVGGNQNGVQGMPMSVGIDQLQQNKGVSVNVIQNLPLIVDAKPTFVMSNKSSPVFDISNNVLILRSEGAEDTQGSGVFENLTSLASLDSQFPFLMLDHGSRSSDIWSNPVQSSATNSYPPNETLHGGNLSGASSITSMSNQSHDSLTEMHSQGLIFTNNSGQVSNVSFQGWDEHNHDSSYHANLIGNSIDSLIDPEGHNSINSTYNRNLDFTFCDPLPMKHDGIMGLSEENSLKQQQDNIMNQQKPQNSPAANNFGSLEDLASSMMKQKQDKGKLLDGSYSCNNN